MLRMKFFNGEVVVDIEEMFEALVDSVVDMVVDDDDCIGIATYFKTWWLPEQGYKDVWLKDDLIDAYTILKAIDLDELKELGEQFARWFVGEDFTRLLDDSTYEPALLTYFDITYIGLR